MRHIWKMCEIYMPFLIHCFRDSIFKEDSMNKQHAIVTEMAELASDLSSVMVKDPSLFVKVSNVHELICSFIGEWNDWICTGCEIGLQHYFTQWRILSSPPVHSICPYCGWTDCKCSAASSIKEIRFGHIRCQKCHWLECKCEAFHNNSNIFFGLRLNRKIMKQARKSKACMDSSTEASFVKVQTPKDHLNRKKQDHCKKSVSTQPDVLEFLLNSAKQRCSLCFVSHTPLKRWCNRSNQKKKSATYKPYEKSK